MDSREYENRIERTRSAMRQEGVDAILAYANYIHGGHSQYLTGYQIRFAGYQSVTPTSSSTFGSAIVALFMEGEPVLFVDSFYGSAEECGEYEAVEVVSTKDFAADIKDLFARKGFSKGRVGLQGWHFFPAPVYVGLTSTSTQLAFEPSTILEKVRMVKSPAEITLMREAERISDIGVQEGLRNVEVGKTEIDVGLAAENAIRRHGELSFVSMISSGLRTAVYSVTATDKVIQEGDLVLMDVGGRYEMYSGDITRMKVCGGSPTDEQRRLLQTVLRMNQTAIEHVRPGIKAADLSSIADQVAIEAGYDKSMIARLKGHGVGYDIHERPDFGVEETQLAVGMVITIEPTLLIPGLGGARIEDLVLVTEEGCEVLSKTPKDVW